jgi:hypothetical protein
MGLATKSLILHSLSSDLCAESAVRTGCGGHPIRQLADVISRTAANLMTIWITDLVASR